MAGYSAKPLIRKLGIQEDARVLLINAPSGYFKLTGQWPAGARLANENDSNVDFIHLFVVSMEDLEYHLPMLKKQIKPNGMIWVSWHKKTSKIPTDVSEDLIRKAAIALGLVDIKVCAIDDNWSGLKLVIRKSNRR